MEINNSFKRHSTMLSTPCSHLLWYDCRSKLGRETTRLFKSRRLITYKMVQYFWNGIWLWKQIRIQTKTNNCSRVTRQPVYHQQFPQITDAGLWPHDVIWNRMWDNGWTDSFASGCYVASEMDNDLILNRIVSAFCNTLHKLSESYEQNQFLASPLSPHLMCNHVT